MDFGPKHEMKLFLDANPQRVSLQVEEAANVKSCLLVRFEPSRAPRLRVNSFYWQCTLH
jgi:hypothetical protein